MHPLISDQAHRRLTTPRLVLDEIRDEDRDALVDILKNDTVTEFYMVPPLATREAEDKMFAALRDLSRRNDRYFFGVFLDGRLIGIFNDTEITAEHVELGYALHPAVHGKGYATEALGAMIGFLFSRGVPRVTAGAFEDNLASLRVMEKCGMQPMEHTDTIEYRGREHLCLYRAIDRQS